MQLSAPLERGWVPVLPSSTAFHCRSLSTDFSKVTLTGQILLPAGQGWQGPWAQPGWGGLEAKPREERSLQLLTGELPALRGPWRGDV